jgi:hypothetical protein
VDARDVTREIRRAVRPFLREAGFETFTGRTAWRYAGTAVDVVSFQSFSASIADAVGCTSFSFSVRLGVWSPGDVEPRLKPDAAGRPRPQEWECGRRTQLSKSIPQPWFDPFSRRDVSRWSFGLRRHRQGLRHVVRRDRHDRADIWFVLANGTNLAAVVEDARRALAEVGVPWLEWARADSSGA